jgi:hypothetical protein
VSGFAGRGFAACALFSIGCFAPLKELENASAIEQEMASVAITRSVAALDVDAIDRATPYQLRIAAPTGVDTALIRARLEQRLARADIRLAPESSTHDATLLAVVPFAGTDAEATLIGFPFAVTGLPIAFGDISLYKSSTVTGRARVELSAWTADQVQVASVPPVEASRYFRNVTFLTFIGPFRFTNLDEGPDPGEEP